MGLPPSEPVVSNLQQALQKVAAAVKRHAAMSTLPVAANPNLRAGPIDSAQAVFRYLVGAAHEFPAAGAHGVSVADLREGMKPTGIPLTEAEAATVVRAFDSDGDGRLAEDDWLRVLAAAEPSSLSARV
jgi:hypothetical protein